MMGINNRTLRCGIAFSFFLVFTSCKENENAANELSSPSIETLAPSVAASFDFFPTSTTGVVVQREGFAFSYSEEFEQSEWVAYVLTEHDFSNRNYNRPFFIEDPKVKTHSADWRNYKKSGYDKGHLCPAGDRKSSYKAFEETFYTSNISPQRHDFNDGVWNRLEQKTRYWAKKYDGIYVITGGVLSDNLKTIGEERVAVPNYFYKVLMTKDAKKMIGFLMPHQESDKPLYEFVVEVDVIEKMTGIDFFSKLPDTAENRMEKTNDYKEWSF